MTAYLNRMPAGIPGEVSRPAHVTLEAQHLGAAEIPFGAVVKLSAGALAPIAAADTASVIYGFLARPFPTTGIDNAAGAGMAPAGTVQSVMRRGYMTVVLKGATAAAKNGAVYVRVTADGTKLVGDIEAAADAGKTVAVPACAFTGAADADGNVEISFNI
ncbi:MAG: hypothetical protein LBQ16_04115 [Gracilibacteraceae bacterium]|jgi:hypothetical protein|nr:hypothetical protein [Gracilibacteraceae bacterium]